MAVLCLRRVCSAFSRFPLVASALSEYAKLFVLLTRYAVGLSGGAHRQ
jgi:hypothetical protein